MKIRRLITQSVILTITLLSIAVPAYAQATGSSCQLPRSKFGIPTWYKYLPGEIDIASKKCQPIVDYDEAKLNVLLGIGIAAIEILIFFAGIVAVGFVIYGGFRYLTSQGEPENTKAAKDTIINAIIGLMIAMVATTIVRFVASRLTS